MQREWKIIPEYPPYEVSNYGEVKSHYQLGELLNPAIDSSGYYILNLRYKSKKRTVRVHALVLELYSSKVEDKTVTNHKDGNKLNNRIDNLERVSYSENLQHAYDLKLREQKKDGSQSNCIKILQYDKQGNFVKEFPALRVAERETKISNISISMACRGIRKTAGGYIWKYKEN